MLNILMMPLFLIYSQSDYLIQIVDDDDDELGFNDASTHEGHLCQNGIFTCFSIERAVMVSHQVVDKDSHIITNNTDRDPLQTKQIHILYKQCRSISVGF